jgi:hypothetical protein
MGRRIFSNSVRRHHAASTTNANDERLAVHCVRSATLQRLCIVQNNVTSMRNVNMCFVVVTPEYPHFREILAPFDQPKPIINPYIVYA